MKTRIMAITALVVMLALPGALYAQETDPAAVVSALAEAVNAGDVDAAMALFAADAVVKLVGLPPPLHEPDTYTGAEEIRAWFEGLVAQNFEIEVEILKVEGDTVTTETSTWSDPTRELGVAPLVATEVYTVQDGKIKGFTWTITDCSLAMLEGAMALEQNKAIARRYIEELWTKGDLALADELIAADFVNHSPAPGETPDREGIKQGVTAFQTGFSDFQFMIEDLIAEGDKVVIPQTFRGTHTGEFAGAPATGKEITMTVIVILRIEGGKIVDRWANVDELGFLIQLGVIAPPGEGGE